MIMTKLNTILLIKNIFFCGVLGFLILLNPTKLAIKNSIGNMDLKYILTISQRAANQRYAITEPKDKTVKIHNKMFDCLLNAIRPINKIGTII